MGVIMDAECGETDVSVLISPDYWHLLPQLALSRSDGLETIVNESPVSRVKKSGEPPSFVTLSNGAKIIGAGACVRYNGSAYLLTASHVWFGASPVIYVQKGEDQVEISRNCRVAEGSRNLLVDFVMVEVPQKVWSVLRVRASPLVTLRKPTIVSCYGGNHIQQLVCSTGIAHRGRLSHDIIHKSTTVNGWSGTPLYTASGVCGIHVASHVKGESNRGVNVGMILEMALETDFSEAGNIEITPYEAEYRLSDFEEVELIGRGRVAIGSGEWFRLPDAAPFTPHIKEIERESTFRMNTWADETFYDSLETIEENLNAPRVAEARRSPPSSLLPSTPGPIPPNTWLKTVNQASECRLASLESQMSNFGKMLEKLLEKESREPTLSSHSSEISAGPIVAPKLSSAHSSFKQEDSPRLNRRRRSRKPAASSSGSIQASQPVLASSQLTGDQIASLQTLLKSASPSSTATPPQASPSAS
jgi:hypothetical protein